MKKGDLVRVKKVAVHSHSAADRELGRFRAERHITEDEILEWRLSPLSKGMNSAGETKLPPTSVTVFLFCDRHYTVLRARCRPVFGWRGYESKMTKVKCTVTGEEAFIKRDNLAVVSEI